MFFPPSLLEVEAEFTFYFRFLSFLVSITMNRSHQIRVLNRQSNPISSLAEMKFVEALPVQSFRQLNHSKHFDVRLTLLLLDMALLLLHYILNRESRSGE